MTAHPLLLIDGLHPRNGGPPHVVVELASQLARLGMRPGIASLCLEDERAETLAAWPELSKWQVPVHLFEPSRPAQMARSAAFQRFCEAHLREFDLLHIHGVWSYSAAFAARLARRTGTHYVVTPHGMLDRWSMARSRWKKYVALKFFGAEQMLRHANGIQFGTTDEAEEARGLGLGAPEFIVPNGFFPERYAQICQEDSMEFLQLFPEIEERYPVFLFLGRFHPKKGIHLLLEAFARVASDHAAATLLILGIPQDKRYETRLVERCQSDDLKGRAFITSKLVGRKALSAANWSHVFVLPSFQEGFSIAILEALALGLPVLATNPCHMSAMESIGAGKVVAASVDDLETGLRSMLDLEAKELQQMGRRGKRWVEAQFSWQVVGERIAQMYEAIRD